MGCWLGLVFASSPERVAESRGPDKTKMAAAAESGDDNGQANPDFVYGVECLMALDVAPIDQGLYAIILPECQSVC